MKSRKLTIFRNVTANIIIVAIIITLTLFAVSGIDSSMSVSSMSNGAYYYGNRSENNVALMFNVYGGTEYLDGILEVLSTKGAKSTFFIGGCWAEKHPDYLKKIKEKGMEIGNHGYLHRDSDKLSREGLKHEIKATENLIKALIGYTTELFAPPSGAINKDVANCASSLGYKTIMWSKDTIDWRDQDSAIITKRATTNAVAGDLILMHPTKATLDALPAIIDALQKEGYLLSSVSDTLALTSA